MIGFARYVMAGILHASPRGRSELLVRHLRGLVRSAGELVFPRRCWLCGGWDPRHGECFCDPCARGLTTERGRTSCPTCAADVARYEVRLDRCGGCRGRSLRCSGTARVASYRGQLGRLLRAYKYRGREELGPVLGAWLAGAVEAAPWRDRVEAVVAVPSHWKRRLHRPFHAADVLASQTAQRLGLPNLAVLRRVRSGPHQIGLSLSERAINVRGAFALRHGVTLHESRLLLIDDVRTTGATIEECAKVLARGGASEVYAAVVLRVSDVRPGGPALRSI